MPESDVIVNGVPDGYQVVRLAGQDPRLGLNVGVLVANERKEGKSPLIVLRSRVDAMVCLGVLVDHDGRAHQRVEVWFQRSDALDGVAPFVRQDLTNHSLDERWLSQCRMMQRAHPNAVIWSGYEDRPAPPCVIDDQTKRVVDLQIDGKPLTLCTDDRALAAAGLAAYSTTLDRYLWTADATDEDALFVPITERAPTNERCAEMPLADEDRYIDLNRCGGRLAIRSFLPVDYNDYLAVLNGKSWRGVIDGRTTLSLEDTVGAPLHADVAELDEDSGFGRMFLGRHGRRGRIIETYHLKLRCLADAIASTYRHTKAVKRPHLGLTDQSFRIQLADRGAGLPFLWANRVALVDPADSVRLQIGNPDAGLYQPMTPAKTSVYRPSLVGDHHAGQTMVRIRRAERLDADAAAPNDSGLTALRVEATLRLNTDLDTARRDLIWLRLRPDQRAIDLYGHAERDAALAPGEMRFTSLALQADRATLTALQQAEGVSLPDCAFNVLPSLSSPCDLYALGVLAVQTMLVNRDAHLPAALDELLSLGRWTMRQDGDATLPQRIASAFKEDPRWHDRLGPHRVMDELDDPEQAFDLIPRDLWWQTLAFMLRMFPGACHESTCTDYSDAHPGLIHKVFEPALFSLRQLIMQSRGLIVIDWHYNREVHELLHGIRAGHLGESD